MTNSYTWVQWNPHKKKYDIFLAACCLLYIGAFAGISSLAYQGEHALSIMVVLIRAFSTLALVLLHIILCIGPMSRFTTLVAPLLYNRRHLGVTMFLAAFVHSLLVLIYYGGFGLRSPLPAVVDGYASYSTISGFPFEILGLGALLILFAMASTSHDFWLAFLSARTWKTLHMMVYLAYGLIVLHVFFGILQSEQHPLYSQLMILGVGFVTTLHLVAGLYERKCDAQGLAVGTDWVDIGEVDDFQQGCGKVICLRDQERVAVFRHGDGLSALSNVCAHQGGPLGEGQIVDGCVTCPWHGYQYLPGNGQSPPPFHEKVPTYELRVDGQRVMLNRLPNEPGSAVEPAAIPTKIEKGVQ